MNDTLWRCLVSFTYNRTTFDKSFNFFVQYYLFCIKYCCWMRGMFVQGQSDVNKKNGHHCCIWTIKSSQSRLMWPLPRKSFFDFVSTCNLWTIIIIIIILCRAWSRHWNGSLFSSRPPETSCYPFHCLLPSCLYTLRVDVFFPRSFLSCSDVWDLLYLYMYMCPKNFICRLLIVLIIVLLMFAFSSTSWFVFFSFHDIFIILLIRPHFCCF